MNNDRVILVKGDKSNWYEQAIFIVKSSVPQSKMPLDLVAEAERIVNKYSHMPRRANAIWRETAPVKVPPARVAKKRTGFDVFMNVVMLLSCSVLVGVLMYAFVQ